MELVRPDKDRVESDLKLERIALRTFFFGLCSISVFVCTNVFGVTMAFESVHQSIFLLCWFVFVGWLIAYHFRSILKYMRSINDGATPFNPFKYFWIYQTSKIEVFEVVETISLSDIITGKHPEDLVANQLFERIRDKVGKYDVYVKHVYSGFKLRSLFLFKHKRDAMTFRLMT